MIGHVHLRVGDAAEAERYWTGEFGFDTVAKLGGSAVFLSTGGYHHHVGANQWQSRGARTRDNGRSGLAWVEMRSSLAGEAAGYAHPWGTEIRIVPGVPA